MRNLDPFRVSGMPYANEEAVAIGIITCGQVIDWSNDEYTPGETLWIPESIFAQLQKRADILGLTHLASIDNHAQTHCDIDVCTALLSEINVLINHSNDDDTSKATNFIKEFIIQVLDLSGEIQLLIEGP